MGNKVFYEISLYQYYVSFHRYWTISYPMFLDTLRIPQPVMFFLHSEAWLSYLVFQAWVNYHTLWKTVTNCALSQFSSVSQSCPTLRDPMNCSTITNSWITQTHVHRVRDAIQSSHPLSAPSPPPFNLSQHQGLFQWVSSSHQVAKVLEFQLQHQSFQWTPRTDLL